MAVLLEGPKEYFVWTTFAATGCMVAAAFLSGALPKNWTTSLRPVAFAAGSAALLYAIFYAGALGVRTLHPFGIGPGAEQGIYSLIASPSNPVPLQVVVLLADAAGFEAYFRGTLQRRLEARLGAKSIIAAAGVDAALHLFAFFRYPDIAPLWVPTTFIADIVWGLTFRASKSLFSSFGSHFAWDLGVFVIAPIT